MWANENKALLTHVSLHTASNYYVVHLLSLSDYSIPQSIQLTFPNGSTVDDSMSFTVTTESDMVVEMDETVMIGFLDTADTTTITIVDSTGKLY